MLLASLFIFVIKHSTFRGFFGPFSLHALAFRSPWLASVTINGRRESINPFHQRVWPVLLSWTSGHKWPQTQDLTGAPLTNTTFFWRKSGQSHLLNSTLLLRKSDQFHYLLSNVWQFPVLCRNSDQSCPTPSLTNPTLLDLSLPFPKRTLTSPTRFYIKFN